MCLGVGIGIVQSEIVSFDLIYVVGARQGTRVDQTHRLWSAAGTCL